MLSIQKYVTIFTAMILAAPSFAEEVNVYSYRQPSLIAPLFKAFTDATDITVNVQFLKKGMIEKLLAEGKRSPADIILTTDISRLNAIVNANLTQAVHSNVLDHNIPDTFRDTDNHWFAITARARVIFASKTRVDPSEITTYEDLISPKWRNRICIRSGTHPYNLALTSAVIAHHGEAYAKKWLKGLKANLARKPQGNDRAQIKAIYAGECDISIGNTYYMKAMLENPDQQAWAEAVTIVYPQFKDGGTHVNVSGIAMTKHAPNYTNAIRLMEWLSSDKAQMIYGEINGEYPINPNFPASDLVKSWGVLKPDHITLSTIATLRSHALTITEMVSFDE